MNSTAAAAKGGEVFERSVAVPASPEELFAWHERPGAFQRLNPPWENVEVKSPTGGIRNETNAEASL